uniref:ALMS motif domain-containing protein n=1 Tax=Oncorhynchus kisutch TaxID=8019 RepID=A0A8C7I0D7_ONCKI
MGLSNQTQNSNIDPVRDWVKDTATSNSRLNTGYSSSSISAGPAGRDREMCPPETESSRPAGRDREMCPPETESSRPAGRDREMCPLETESSRPEGIGTEREMCPPESESSRPAGRDREMCPLETESSRPAGRDREMCPPETESSRPAGRHREMCPLETESSRPEGIGTEREGDLTQHPHQADARSSQPQPPAITLIKHQEPQSHQQSPEAVLALNAAAVIAHIKLQRQLSLRKTTPHDLSTQDSRSPTTPEGGKALVKDAGGCVRPRTDDNRLDPGETTRTKHHTTQIDVGFIPLNSDSDPETSKVNIPSPREALERSRPHFIIRSQGRLREMERRAEERREERHSDHQPEEMMLMHHRGHSTRTSPLSDNLFRPRDRAITGKEMQLRTRQNYKNLPEVRRKQEEEKRREDYLTNRLRADLFKKKLLEQILQRASH